MIPKYRNKAFLRLGIGFVLLIIGAIGLGIAQERAIQATSFNRLAGFVCVVCGIIGYVVYVFGCSDLLKAKGYDGSLALGFIIPAFCCSLAFLLLAPPIILFAFKDKTKRRRQVSSR